MKCPECKKRMKFIQIIKSELTGFKRRVNYCDNCNLTCLSLSPQIKITSTFKESTGILKLKLK